jgi:hypothetical protein
LSILVSFVGPAITGTLSPSKHSKEDSGVGR